MLAALLLGLACAPLHAQPTEKKAPFKTESTRTERERDRHGEHKAPAKAREQRAPMAERPQRAEAKKKPPPYKVDSTGTERERDRHREHEPPASAREQRGAMNATPKPPGNKQFRVHPSETRPRPTAPSVAEQQQRQMEEQRRVQQGNGTSDPLVFQCSARPVCGGGGYGRCASVQQTYRGGTEESRRRDMVDECIQANSPDTCQCAVQCRRVAQCSIF